MEPPKVQKVSHWLSKQIEHVPLLCSFLVRPLDVSSSWVRFFRFPEMFSACIATFGPAMKDQTAFQPDNSAIFGSFFAKKKKKDLGTIKWAPDPVLNGVMWPHKWPKITGYTFYKTKMSHQAEKPKSMLEAKTKSETSAPSQLGNDLPPPFWREAPKNLGIKLPSFLYHQSLEWFFPICQEIPETPKSGTPSHP